MPAPSHRRALALALVLAGASRPALAAPSWLELRWPSVAGCPTEAMVEAAILDLTAGGAPTPVSATATITAVVDGLRLDLVVRDPGGSQRRILESPRCDALADATAVIVAVTADPLALAARLEASPAADERPPPGPAIATIDPALDGRVVEPPPTDELDVESIPLAASSVHDEPRAAPRRAPPQLGLSFGTAAGIGPTQRFAAGLRGGLFFHWRRARAELRGSYWFPSPVRDPERPDVGVDLRLAAASLRAGPRLVRGALAFALTGGVELGALLARGVGFVDNQRSDGLWAAGVVAGDLQWSPRRWLALGLEIEPLVAFTRRQYTAADAPTSLYTVPPAGIRLGGGFALIFP